MKPSSKKVTSQPLGERENDKGPRRISAISSLHEGIEEGKGHQAALWRRSTSSHAFPFSTLRERSDTAIVPFILDGEG
jgi:hypothetical protein